LFLSIFFPRRTVTETLSPVEDLGQEEKAESNDVAEEDKVAEAKPEGNGAGEDNGETFDKLELRNRSPKQQSTTDQIPLYRTVTETLSPVSELGQDGKDEEAPEAKKQKFDTLSLRNREVTETLSPLET
jgi:hypothetical protein